MRILKFAGLKGDVKAHKFFKNYADCQETCIPLYLSMPS